MVEHLEEIVKTGDYSLRKKLLKKISATISTCCNAVAGAEEGALLWKIIQGATVADVEKIAKEGKLRELDGFGEKSEQNILKAVEVFRNLRAIPLEYGGRSGDGDYRAH